MGHVVEIEQPHRSTDFFSTLRADLVCFDGWKVKKNHSISLAKTNDDHLLGGWAWKNIFVRLDHFHQNQQTHENHHQLNMSSYLCSNIFLHPKAITRSPSTVTNPSLLLRSLRLDNASPSWRDVFLTKALQNSLLRKGANVNIDPSPILERHPVETLSWP